MKKILYVCMTTLLLSTVIATTALADDALVIASADKKTVEAGDEVTYTISVENDSGSAIQGLSFITNLPDGIDYVSNSINEDNFSFAHYNEEKSEYMGVGASGDGITDPSWQVMNIVGKVGDDALPGVHALTLSDIKISAKGAEPIPAETVDEEITVIEPPETTPTTPAEPTPSAQPTTPARTEDSGSSSTTTTPSPQPVQTSTGSSGKDSVPKTGESSPFAALLIVAAAGAAGMCVFGRKKNVRE